MLLILQNKIFSYKIKFMVKKELKNIYKIYYKIILIYVLFNYI